VFGTLLTALLCAYDSDSILSGLSNGPIHATQDNLPRISDRRWVVTECLTRLAPDHESQRLLINYGLRETDRHAGPKAAELAAAAAAQAAAEAALTSPAVARSPTKAAGGEQSEEGQEGSEAPQPTQPGSPAADGAAGEVGQALQWTPQSIGHDGAGAQWWRWRRLELWRHSDRLDTFRVRLVVIACWLWWSAFALRLTQSKPCLWPPTPPTPTQAMRPRQPHDPAAFAAFCTSSLPAAALDLAAAGDVATLSTLLIRHPAALGAGLLAILSALPAALDPHAYAALLPDAGTGAPSGLKFACPASVPLHARMHPPPGALSAAGRWSAAVAAVTQPTGSGGRQSDWAECPEAWRELAAVAGSSAKRGSSDGGAREARREEAASLMHATEDMVRAGLAAAAAGAAKATHGVSAPKSSASIWPAPAEVAEWYVRRVLLVDAAGCQLARVLSLIDLALQRGAGATVALAGNIEGSGDDSPPETSLSLGRLQRLGGVLAAAQGDRQSDAGAQESVRLGEFAVLPLAPQLLLVLQGRGLASLESDVQER
jgi:hypothetical protein